MKRTLAWHRHAPSLRLGVICLWRFFMRRSSVACLSKACCSCRESGMLTVARRHGSLPSYGAIRRQPSRARSRWNPCGQSDRGPFGLPETGLERESQLEFRSWLSWIIWPCQFKVATLPCVHLSANIPKILVSRTAGVRSRERHISVLGDQPYKWDFTSNLHKLGCRKRSL